MKIGWIFLVLFTVNEAKEASIIIQKARRVNEIDKIPFPAWDLFPIDNYLSRNLNYHIQRGRTIPMLASRGCPYKCTFCSNTNNVGKSLANEKSQANLR